MNGANMSQLAQQKIQPRMTNSADNQKFSRKWLTFIYSKNQTKLDFAFDIFCDFYQKQASNVSQFYFLCLPTFHRICFLKFQRHFGNVMLFYHWDSRRSDFMVIIGQYTELNRQKSSILLKIFKEKNRKYRPNLLLPLKIFKVKKPAICIHWHE